MKKPGWTEYEKLELFAEQAQILSQMRLISGEFQFGATIEVDIFSAEVIEKDVDDEDMRSFLTMLRPFLSEKEPVYLHHIYNISERLISDAEVLAVIRKSRKQWKQERKTPGLKIFLNKRLIASDEIVDWWLNGKYFHHDKEKKARIDRLSPIARAVTRFEFLSSVIRAANHVIWVGTNLRYAFNHRHVGYQVKRKHS